MASRCTAALGTETGGQPILPRLQRQRAIVVCVFRAAEIDRGMPKSLPHAREPICSPGLELPSLPHAATTGRPRGYGGSTGSRRVALSLIAGLQFQHKGLARARVTFRKTRPHSWIRKAVGSLTSRKTRPRPSRGRAACSPRGRRTWELPTPCQPCCSTYCWQRCAASRRLLAARSALIWFARRAVASAFASASSRRASSRCFVSAYPARCVCASDQAGARQRPLPQAGARAEASPNCVSVLAKRIASRYARSSSPRC